MIRSFSPTFGAKKEVTVATPATAALLVAKDPTGPQTFRLVNHDSVKVAYRFGNSAVVASLTDDPCLPAGAVEIVTVYPPNAIGASNDLYLSVISDTSPAGNKFEATPGTPGL